jgi:hypothetical protein
MERSKFAKIISLHEVGIVSAAEFANSLLLELLSEPDLDESFVSSPEWLPEDVRRKFLDLLKKIQAADYHWIPFLVTSVPDRSEPPDYPEKLRKICARVGEEGQGNRKTGTE